MTQNTLEIFSVPEGDWEALYVNGELEVESHKVHMEDILEYVPIGEIFLVYITNFDSDEDCFPDKIEQFPNAWICD